MNCEKDKQNIIDYINHEMTDGERSAFDIHLEGCAECRKELKTQQQVWDMLTQIPVPQPSAKLDSDFKTMLDEFTQAPVHPIEKSNSSFTIKTFWKVAAVLILVFAGFGAGYYFNRPTVSYTYKQQIDSLSAQVHDMREMMMLSLLENPSASERIRAVGYTSEINNVNAKMIDALLTTLNNDPNVNVRLMTLEALTHYAGNTAVREGLVQSIVQQESPLVQSAMADAMLKMQEKRSIQPFKKLLEQKTINVQVRTKIEQTISRLT